jgi:hypothetical protein
MAGGPVNGVSWAAMLMGMTNSVSSGGEASSAPMRGSPDANDPVNYTGIIVPTVLQMAADTLNYWSSVTCLYDRYWSAEDDRITLPICMFHVKKITPAFSNEVSKKRVILYEPVEDRRTTSEKLADPLRSGVMQTVVDNVVKNPRTYTMEIIVPFQPIGRYINEGIKTISDMVATVSDLLGYAGSFVDWSKGVFSSVYAVMRTAATAVELAGKMPGTDGVSYLNMNSLEAMADSCRTLCMKMWTGYEYKFVLITNMTYDKDPKEDDVFRATLTLQEMPVLAIAKPDAPKLNQINRTWAATAITAMQRSLIAPLVMMTDVEQAAGSSNALLKALTGSI